VRDIFVVCRTPDEFDSVIASGQKAWRYEVDHFMIHFVNHPSELKTHEPARVVLVGDWTKRNDWKEIDLMIALYKHKRITIK
jgi:hypothetical protein